MTVRSRQSGVVLAVVLTVLLAMMLLAVGAAHLTVAGLRLSGSEELRLEAMDHAQSLVDAAIDDLMRRPEALEDRAVTCSADCAGAAVRIPDALRAIPGQLSARIVRIAPVLGPPPEGYSARCFQTAQFEASGSYDGTVERRGRATVVEGFQVLVQNGSC